MGNHLFVIFAVLDVSFAVNSCLNRSFFYIYYSLMVKLCWYLLGKLTALLRPPNLDFRGEWGR